MRGDLGLLATESVDLIITSPPYLNAIDYLRCSKFSLVWMGYSVGGLRRLRSTTVGTEVGLDARDDQEIQRNSCADLELAAEAARQDKRPCSLATSKTCNAPSARPPEYCANNGRAVYVVGENTVRDTFIRNALIVETAASALQDSAASARHSRELPANRRYLPPPSEQSEAATLDNRLRREVILTFQKAA